MKKKKNLYNDNYYTISQDWKTATNCTSHYEKNLWSQSATNPSYKNWAVKHLRPYDDYESYKSTLTRSPSRDIIELVAAGDIAGLKKYTEDLLNRIARNESQQWIAGANGQIAVLQLFCEQGIDLREGQFNALRGAAIHNQLPVIEWLHGKGLISEKHRTECLNLAAERGHIEIIKWLCANGASIHDIRKSSYPDPKTRDLIADMKRERINNIVAAAITEAAAEKSASPVRRLLGRLGL